MLAQAFGSSCFCCDRQLSAKRHVDHVLPWSRVGIDGLTNLALTCERCDSSKSGLPTATYAWVFRSRPSRGSRIGRNNELRLIVVGGGRAR